MGAVHDDKNRVIGYVYGIDYHNHDYVFQVRAVNSVGEADFSNEAHTDINVILPGPITELWTDGGDGQVMVSWKQPAAPEHWVRWKQVQSDGSIDYGDWKTGTSDSHYIMTGLTNGEAYQFEVLPVSNNGIGPRSSTVTGTPQSGIKKPGAITGLTAVAGAGKVDLSWTNPTSGGTVAGYELSYWLTSSPSNVSKVIFRGSQTTYEATAEYIEPGVSNSFSIRAYNGAGFSDSSASVTATPTAATSQSKINLSAESDTSKRFGASFHDLPLTHDGTAFTFGLSLSEEVDELSSTTIRDSLIKAEGATISQASRVNQESNKDWNIQVVPDGNGDVKLWVDASASCDDDDAVCTDDGRKLTLISAAIVPGRREVTITATPETPSEPEPTPETPLPEEQNGEALTATWSPPASHDGTQFTFRLSFNKPMDLSFRNLRDVIIEADGGRVIKSRRVVKGSNQDWNVTVVPNGTGDITLRLNVRGACGDNTAICSTEGELLTTGLTDTVSGPVIQEATSTPNSPATGQPDIGGTAQTGETLTANTSGIGDLDGLNNAVFSYQWLADDTAISGATGSTYTLTDNEVGKTIKVRVSFTDDQGNSESTTSDPSAQIEAAPEPEAEATPEPEAPEPEAETTPELPAPTLNGMKAPANLAARVWVNNGGGSPHIIELTWDDPENSSITIYQFRIQKQGTTEWLGWWDYPGTSASTTKIRIGHLDEGEDYIVQVRSMDDGQPGLASEIPFTTPAAAN